MRRVGKSICVTAIDPFTRVEVIMVAPADTTRAEIKRHARRKLAYVLGKRQNGGDGDGDESGVKY